MFPHSIDTVQLKEKKEQDSVTYGRSHAVSLQKSKYVRFQTYAEA